MDISFLTRSYLETLSSADLISLADDYDIDIPSDLNRRFIIGELLEISEELKRNKKTDMLIASDADPGDVSDRLPETYNETHISVVLRNPVWAFVYWDIRETDLSILKSEKSQSVLSLNVLFFDSDKSAKVADSFDIQIPLSEREQYILLPADKKYVRIDLSAVLHNQGPQILASSRRVELPHGCTSLVSSCPGKVLSLTPIMKISGMEDLLRVHYMQHRQSFS
jgi:uncharacterized protein